LDTAFFPASAPDPNFCCIAVASAPVNPCQR
jgi:hypothetical protein